MEVYKITSKTTGKVFIGSTIHSKESVWKSKNSGTSHYRRMMNGNPDPLYEDMRRYGMYDFELETIYYMDADPNLTGRQNRTTINKIEREWIIRYAELLGPDKLYNKNIPNVNKKYTYKFRDKEFDKIEDMLPVINDYGFEITLDELTKLINRPSNNDLARFNNLVILLDKVVN